MTEKLAQLVIGVAALVSACPTMCAETAPPPYLRTGFQEAVAGEQWAYGKGEDAQTFTEIARAGEHISLQGSDGKRIDLYPGHVRELLAGNVWEIWPNDIAWADTSEVVLSIGDTFVVPGFKRGNECHFPHPTFRVAEAQGATLLVGDGRASPTLKAHNLGSGWAAEPKMVKIGDLYNDFLTIPADQTNVVLTVHGIEDDSFAEHTILDVTCGEFWVSLLPPEMSLVRLGELLHGRGHTSEAVLRSESLAELDAFLDEETARFETLSPVNESKSEPVQTPAQIALGQWHPAILQRALMSIPIVESANLAQLEQLRLVTERTFGKASNRARGVRARMKDKYARSGELVKQLQITEEELAIAEGQEGEDMGPYWTMSAHRSLALQWILLGKYANAEVAFRKAIDVARAMNGDSVEDLQLDLADTIAQQGRIRDAMQEFDAVIESLGKKTEVDEEAIQFAILQRAKWRYIWQDCALAESDYVKLRELAVSGAEPDGEYIDELDLSLAFTKMCLGRNAETIPTLESLRERARNNSASLSTRSALLNALYRSRDLSRVDIEIDSILEWAVGKDIYVPGYELMKINAGLLSRKIDGHLPALVSAQISAAEVDVRQRSWQLDLEGRIQLDPKAVRNATWTFARQARDAPSAGLAALESLLFKDVATDISASSERASATDQDPEVVKTLSALQSVAAQLSFSAVNPEAHLDASRLKAIFERLEQTLVDRLKASQSAEVPSVEELQRKLGDRILLEFRVFRDVGTHPYEWLTNPFDDERPDSRHLGAVVVDQASVNFVDLGEWVPVLTTIAAYRAAISDRDALAADALSRKLYQLIWAPLAEQIRPDATLIVSADAELNFVPFSALRDASGQYLLQLHPIQSVGAARDLLNPPADQATLGPPLLVYSPAYWLSERPRQDPKLPKWEALSGVQAEGLEVERILRRGTQSLHTRSGKHATETVLRTAKRPAILHIATHGYFFDVAPAVLGKGRGAFVAPASSLPAPSSPTSGIAAAILPSSAGSFVLDRNPLLRVGLVLAGANDTLSGSLPRDADSGVDDGLLTALEVQALDLRGTKLVVLSACETGIGEFRSGAGVASLQRSFLVAGADSVIYSLWKVDDAATRVLMNRLYAAVIKEVDPNVALRTAQLSMLKEGPYQAPWMWAAFVGTPSGSTVSPVTVSH